MDHSSKAPPGSSIPPRVDISPPSLPERASSNLTQEKDHSLSHRHQLDSLYDSGFSIGHSSGSIISPCSSTYCSIPSQSHLLSHQQHHHLHHSQHHPTGRTSSSSGMGHSSANDSGLCDSGVILEFRSEPIQSEPSESEKKLLESPVGLDAFAQDSDGDTLLHLSILKGRPQLCHHIIRHAPHPDALDIQNDDHQSPLHLAASCGHFTIVRRLLLAGGTVDLRDKFGNTALHSGCRTGNVDVVHSLLHPLHPSEAKGSQGNVHYKIIVEPNQWKPIDLLNSMNYDGQTCVHLAVESGNKQLLEYLKSAEADFDAQEGKEGSTPLHWAVSNLKLDIVKILVDLNVDLNVINYMGRSPLAIITRMQMEDFEYQSHSTQATIQSIKMLLEEKEAQDVDFFNSDSEEEESDFSDSDIESNSLNEN